MAPDTFKIWSLKACLGVPHASAEFGLPSAHLLTPVHSAELIFEQPEDQKFKFTFQ